MSGFSRSLRSPSYLSARRRPTMPGRTVSGSSDRSMASDDGAADHGITSQPTTPIQAYQSRRYGTAHHNSATAAESAPAARDYLGSGARPISIEIPRVNRINTSSVYTPPEPLSARGDLPGGYFPMHEDPSSRVHRPHPFHRETRPAPKNHALTDSEVLAELDRHPLPQISTTSPNMSTHTNIPVASYYPTGYSENSLPMGKYYPSNYESRNPSQKKRQASSSPPDQGSPISDGTGDQPALPSQADTRRKLQQYQRDMMAQVSLRAHEILSPSGQSGKGSSKHTNLAGLKGLPSSYNLSSAAMRKPNSPRLHPLGSPGPVTPMELEESDGNYLNKGKDAVVSPSARMGPPPGKGYHANTT